MTDAALRAKCEELVLGPVWDWRNDFMSDAELEPHLLRFAQSIQAEVWREAGKLVASGRFLHYEAPDAIFARALLKVLEAKAKALEGKQSNDPTGE